MMMMYIRVERVVLQNALDDDLAGDDDDIDDGGEYNLPCKRTLIACTNVDVYPC